MIKKLLQGTVVGVANIIPGVSGGTMLVAMGLYDKLIHAITHLRKEFKESMMMLIPILIGAGLAIVVLSRLITFCLTNYPIQTNFCFCGLITGSLPAIFAKLKGHKVTISKVIPFLIFFTVVVSMALLGDASGEAADVSFGLINVVKLFAVGVIAAATMVVPGVSGSMMLMLLGYYETILASINDFITALTSFDIAGLLKNTGILMPFGIGVIVGIFLIAKVIEYIFARAEVHAYYAILGLIVASPIAILWKTSWDSFSFLTILISCGTFVIGWAIARKLGGDE